MANDVFANGREISCKKADGKSICAFPDVCFTPPENPATPPGVPVPYPNTAFAKDTTSGSKTVKISDQEVMLKNKSYFKTSTGDEAGCAAKKGVITSKIKGKAYFISWSMDVKFEGENVVRHIDMTTHNHASPIPNEGIPLPYADRMSMIIQSADCHEEVAQIEKECDPPEEKAKCPSDEGVAAAKSLHKNAEKGSQAKSDAQIVIDLAIEQYAIEIRENDCLKALRCAMVEKGKGSRRLCCPHQTPEHIVPGAQLKLVEGYEYNKAACICAEGGKSVATHGLLGAARRDHMDKNGVQKDDEWDFSESVDCAAQTSSEVFKHCSEECLKSQLKQNHKDMGVTEETTLGTQQESVLKDNTGMRAELGLHT